MDLPNAPIRTLSAEGFGRDLVCLSAPCVHTRRRWCWMAHSTRPTQECVNRRRMLRPLLEHRRVILVPAPDLRAPARRGSAPILSYARRELADVAALVLEMGPNRNQTEQREDECGVSRRWSEKCRSSF